jgi:hypothetical protein
MKEEERWANCSFEQHHGQYYRARQRTFEGGTANGGGENSKQEKRPASRECKRNGRWLSKESKRVVFRFPLEVGVIWVA